MMSRLIAASNNTPLYLSRVHQASVVVGDLHRTYTFYLPRRLRAHPSLVFVFHGSDGNGQRARRATGYEFDKLAEKHGFIAVYPDGYEHHWNGCRKSGPYSANKMNIDDVGFVESLITRFSEDYSVDLNQIFVMGISNGGHMSYRLALERPRKITAVAVTIASLPDTDNQACTPKGIPIPVMIVNGTDDPINPYAGGRVNLFGAGDRGTVISTRQTFDYWKNLAGHTDPLITYDFPDRNPNDNSWVERTTANSPDKPEISLYTIHGGGHTLPHPYIQWPSVLGNNNRDINIANEIFSFFQRQTGGKQ